MTELYLALLLPLLAGLSTTIGSFIAFFMKKPSKSFISVMMGFSAGVMILVSFVELLQEGIETNGVFFGMVWFFLGMLIMLIIDATITHQYEFEDSIKILTNPNGTCDYSYQTPKQHRNPFGFSRKNNSKNSPKTQENLTEPTTTDLELQSEIQGRHRHGPKQKISELLREEKNLLEKTSVFVFLGVFIHNLPEGMATFIGTIKDFELGLLLAIAIALHNIPEGIAVSVPIYVCTENRKKAFFWSFLSGISEFLGAVIVALILFPFINDAVLGMMLSIVAGIMVYISLDELLPVAHSFGEEHHAIIGLMIGMFVMAISIILI